MKINHPADEQLAQAALSKAFEHPSQVTQTIRHLLRLPLASVMGLHELGRANLMPRLEAIRDAGWKRIRTVPAVRGQNSFMIKPARLQSIEISDCHDFVLDLEAIHQQYDDKDARAKYVITLRNCRNFIVRGGHFVEARNVVFVERCESFSISGLRCQRTEGYGIIVFNSHIFEIRDCVHLDSLASGLYCLGDVSNGWIHHNTYQDGVGFFNWDAGMHINHCSLELTSDQIPELSHEAKKITEKVLKPSYLYVEHNLLTGNRAQGIYCEGVILSTFEGNTLLRNNKEGICFDWGSALNVFRDNTVMSNGERARLTPVEIKADFIEHHPVLADNSSSCKLPGLSIDNGAVNFITRNRFHFNYGGGIKMVRTGISNLIFENTILGNDLGRNEFFTKFNGVFMLGMGAGSTEFDADAKLDFHPSAHNFVFRNTFMVDPRDKCFAFEPSSPDNVEGVNVNLRAPFEEAKTADAR